MQYTVDRIFYLFALLYPEQNVVQLQQGLGQGDVRLRANAIELLDTLATREVKEEVLPLIEASQETILTMARSQLEFSPRSLEERLAELIWHPSGWVRACVLFQIGSLRLQGLSHLVLAGLTAEDVMVRETAVYASQQLLSPDEFRRILMRETAVAPEPVRLYVSKLLANMDRELQVSI
jgi:hypothetical protein